MNVVVASVMFSEQGIDLQCIDLDTDQRLDGRLVQARNFTVGPGTPFSEDAEELARLAQELAEDLIGNFNRQPVTQARPDDDEDEDD